MNRAEYERRMAEAVPHGPDDPCTCDGTTSRGERCVCVGHVIGCTCDIDWEVMYELGREGWSE
jgi:hypothetical protein